MAARLVSRRRPGRRRRRPPAWLFPRALEREYEAWLVEYFANPLRESVTRHILSALPGVVAQASSLRPDSATARIDAWPEDVTRLLSMVSSDMALPIDRVKGKALDISLRLSQQNRGEWAKIMTAIGGANPMSAEPWLRPQLTSFAEANAALITSLEGDAIGKIQGMTLRGMQQGLRWEEIAESIETQFDTTEARARLIARDQTAKLNGELTELRQKDAGIEQYVWRTSRDERVRGRPGGAYPSAEPSHWAMEGLTCRWDDSSVYLDGDRWHKRSGINGPDGHPGEADYQCRCYAEPVLPDFMGQPDKPLGLPADILGILS